LDQAEFEETVDGVGTAESVSGELVFSGVGFILLEPEAAEVVMGLRKVAIQKQGALIGFLGFGWVAGIVLGEAEIIPGMSVGCEQRSGGGELVNSLGELSLFDQALAFEQSAGPGGGAAEQKKGAERACGQRERVEQEVKG
jgi:hypothetical protein